MTVKHLYLCQHGDALAKDIDPDRPLSKRGTTDLCNVANALSGVIAPGAVVHSGKTRARQSAELLHERLAPGAPITAESGLGPKDSAADFARRLGDFDDHLLVAGHMPFVGAVASCLLGESGRNLVAFQPGTVAALESDEDGNWLMSWMLTPRLVSR